MLDRQVLRSIDFLVLGVPRSGTSALVKALNLDPGVFCGMELLDASDKHANFNYPASFYRIGSLTDNQRKALTIQANAKPNPDLIGNKQPRYYLQLAKVRKEIPAAKIIWLYRSCADYAPSWTVRAANSNDQLWERGQSGVFGILELLVCIEALIKAEDEILIVPYRRLFFEEADAFERVFSFLGRTATPEMIGAFRADLFANPAVRAKKRILRDIESELVQQVDADYLDGLICSGGCQSFAELRQDLADYLDRVQAQTIRKFFQLQQHLSVVEKDYFTRWLRLPGISRFVGRRNILYRAFLHFR